VLLAVLLNIKTFGAAVLLDQWVCRRCGYDFEPVRATR
jgi:hypothetical protein